MRDGPKPGAAADRSLEATLRRRARELGFADLGITTADDPGNAEYLRSWLDQGSHGEMAWLSTPDAVDRRGDLSATLPGVRSVIVVADSYPAGTDQRAGAGLRDGSDQGGGEQREEGEQGEGRGELGHGPSISRRAR